MVDKKKGTPGVVTVKVKNRDYIWANWVRQGPAGTHQAAGPNPESMEYTAFDK